MAADLTSPALKNRPMRLYLVSARNGEFVAFTDRRDARYAATGDAGGILGVSSLADVFRECCEADDGGDEEGEGEHSATLPIIEIELTSAQAKQAGITS